MNIVMKQKIVLILLSLALLSHACQYRQPESEASISDDTISVDDSVTALLEKDIPDQVISDTTLYNPSYRAFYGGLNIKTIIKLYHMKFTSSGPANPLKIRCKPEYSDTATGIYFLYGEDGFHADVYVSIYRKGFYDSDTTQRINKIYVYHESCRFSEYFPFQIGQELPKDKCFMKSKESDLFIFKEKDYTFCLLVEDNRILSFLIQRNYCPEVILDKSESQKFKRNMRRKHEWNQEM